MKYCNVGFTAQQTVCLGSGLWEKAEMLEVNCYPWDGAGSCALPRTEVRLLWNPDGVFVRFGVREDEILATYTKPNDPVCRDSCVEFFLTPNLTDPRYLSFEVNPLGTMLIGFGKGGHDIRYLDGDRSAFHIEAEKSETRWAVAYCIPFSFLRQSFGKVGRQFRGNFMKCADRSSSPHHGCWNPIGTEIPMFHVPQYFGRINLCGGG